MVEMPSSRYIQAVLADWLDRLESHHELVIAKAEYNPAVRAQLLQITAVTTDRYLKAERDR